MEVRLVIQELFRGFLDTIIAILFCEKVLVTIMATNRLVTFTCKLLLSQLLFDNLDRFSEPAFLSQIDSER